MHSPTLEITSHLTAIDSTAVVVSRAVIVCVCVCMCGSIVVPLHKFVTVYMFATAI